MAASGDAIWAQAQHGLWQKTQFRFAEQGTREDREDAERSKLECGRKTFDTKEAIGLGSVGSLCEWAPGQSERRWLLVFRADFYQRMVDVKIQTLSSSAMQCPTSYALVERVFYKAIETKYAYYCFRNSHPSRKRSCGCKVTRA